MTPPDKLQHIYDKHAKDFGLSGVKNTDQLQKLQAALEAHEQNTSTQHYKVGIVDSQHYWHTLQRQVLWWCEVRAETS